MSCGCILYMKNLCMKILFSILLLLSLDLSVWLREATSVSRRNFHFQEFWKALGHFCLVRFIYLILIFNSENFWFHYTTVKFFSNCCGLLFFAGLFLVGFFCGFFVSFFCFVLFGVFLVGLVWVFSFIFQNFRGKKYVCARKSHEQQIMMRINTSELSDQI